MFTTATLFAKAVTKDVGRPLRESREVCWADVFGQRLHDDIAAERTAAVVGRLEAAADERQQGIDRAWREQLERIMAA